MRAFLDAAETHIASEPAPGALAAWLDWARAYVEDFDPLSSASLEELRAETEHLLSLPKDDGDWDEDEQEWRDMGWLDDLSWLDERDRGPTRQQGQQIAAPMGSPTAAPNASRQMTAVAHIRAGPSSRCTAPLTSAVKACLKA